MTRHDWALLVGMGLCGGLLPACTHTKGNVCASWETAAAPAELTPPAPAEMKKIAAAAEPKEIAAPASPYHAIPVTPVQAAPAKPKQKPSEPVTEEAPPPKVIELTADEVPQPIEPAQYQEKQAGIDLEPKPKTNRIKPVKPEPRMEVKPQQPEILPTTLKPVGQESPLLIALRCYLDKRPAEAIAILGQYEKSSQDVLLCLLPLAAHLADTGLDKTGDKSLGMVLEQLNSMMVPLRTRAPLLIDKMCLCRSIGGFGDYVPLPADHVFRSGELVRLYVEMRNFQSDRREIAPGQMVYVTELGGRAEIRDFTGKPVWSQEFHRDRPDQSQSLRTDYFEHYRFCLPELSPGPYTLWLWVKDASTKRPEASRTLDFHVGHVPAARGD